MYSKETNEIRGHLETDLGEGQGDKVKGHSAISLDVTPKGRVIWDTLSKTMGSKGHSKGEGQSFSLGWK